MHSAKVYWKLARPFTLLPPITSILCGAIVASAVKHARFRMAPVILAVFAIAFLNAGSNGLNQIYDVAADRINKPWRPLPAGQLTFRQAWTFVVIACVAALATVCAIGQQTFALYAAMALCSIAYSVPPVRAKQHPFASNLIIASSRAELLLLAGWSVISSVLDSIQPWYIGFVLFAFLLGAATTKDFADLEGDRATGCITLPVRFGVSGSARIA
jgi:4-hydroxybenzoate polyprenyltransferase